MHHPVAQPEHHGGRVLIGGTRPLVGALAPQPQVPSNSSGDRHSTPHSSDTGKLWSPAFHFADDAPVQNQRKRTVRPSKDALPSYALNDSGTSGASTRNRSVGPDSVSSPFSSSA